MWFKANWDSNVTDETSNLNTFQTEEPPLASRPKVIKLIVTI